MENNVGFTLGDDPVHMQSLVGKCVEVETIENKILSGTVYVVDPLSKTVVLVNKSGERYKVDLLLHHALKSLKVIVGATGCSLPNFTPSTEETQELEKKKSKLKTWLTANLIDVEENGPILYFKDKVMIEPPYGIEQCYCSNTIILDRLHKIMNNMPSGDN